jgi:hypothetical protein
MQLGIQSTDKSSEQSTIQFAIRIKAMSLHGKVYILVTWPESQEFMDALGAFLILDPDIAGSSAYMVPEEVFQNYRTPFHNGSYYIHGAPPPDECNSSSDDDDDYDDSMP